MHIDNINDEKIQNLVYDYKTYARGSLYFHNDRVRELEYDVETNAYYATVKGSDEYEVVIGLDEDNRIESMHCDCPAYSKYTGACKHVVATLKALKREAVKRREILDSNKRAVEYIFSYINSANEENKREVKLEVCYILQQYGQKMMSGIELKIGLDRMYVLRDVKRFINDLREKQEIRFGKQLTFDPYIHTFKDADKKLIHMIEDIFENEDTLDYIRPYTTSPQSAFDKKTVYLTEANLVRFFDIMKDRDFSADIMGDKISLIKIFDKDMPITYITSNTLSSLVIVNNCLTCPTYHKGSLF